MRSIAVVFALTLSGCAATELVSENGNTVIVKAELKKSAEAQVLADKSCEKFGKTAKLNQFVPANKVWANYVFDCK